MTERRRLFRRGQAMIELAILLPFLLTLVSAIVEFGFYLYDFIGTQSALRAGASAVLLADKSGNPFYTDNQIKGMMQAAHGPINPIEPEEISVTAKEADPVFGGTRTSVTVAISHNHAFILPVFFFGNRSSIPIYAALKTFRVPGMSP